nr:hypothetical protein SEVIR_9G377600v2 [Setaria viridis]
MKFGMTRIQKFTNSIHLKDLASIFILLPNFQLSKSLTAYHGSGHSTTVLSPHRQSGHGLTIPRKAGDPSVSQRLC